MPAKPHYYFRSRPLAAERAHAAAPSLLLSQGTDFDALRLRSVHVYVRAARAKGDAEAAAAWRGMPPLAGVLLSLSGPGSYRRNAHTLAHGRVAFDELQSGQYHARPQCKPGLNHTLGRRWPLAMCMRACACACACARVRMCACACVRVRVCMGACACVHGCVCACARVHACACACACVRVCMGACARVRVCMRARVRVRVRMCACVRGR